MYLECKKCQWKGQPDLKYSGQQNQHVKALCPECKSYIKFVKQSDLDHEDYQVLDKDAIEESRTDFEIEFECPECGTSMVIRRN